MNNWYGPDWFSKVREKQATNYKAFYHSKPMMTVIILTGLLYSRIRSSASNTTYDPKRKQSESENKVKVIGHS